jgi:hypothetical protein
MIFRPHIDAEAKSLLQDQPALLAVAESVVRNRESIAWSLGHGGEACCWNRGRAARRKKRGDQ